MFALVDCNNFYASCERLFRPDLREKPIIVLSNNDGCVIARSNEAKQLGIKMGVPYFQIRSLCRTHNVHVFSSNFSLYGDLSRRIMSILKESWPLLEIYSVDEAFLDLRSLPAIQLDSFVDELQRKITQYTGIPVSIGLGATKTLAKLANHIAKKELQIPVFNINQNLFWLSRISIQEVWGIGRQWGKTLLEQGIYTAHDLAALSLSELKNRYNVTLYSTALELKGIVCFSLHAYSPRKSIISSRSFGSLQSEYEPISQALTHYCTRAWEKLREQESLTYSISVFIKTNKHRKDLPQRYEQASFRWIKATHDLRELVLHAKLCLNTIFRPGYFYQKVGVVLTDLVQKEAVQYSLFEANAAFSEQKTEQLMSVLEQINKKYGAHTLHLAAEGHSQSWKTRTDNRSPRYTTRWSDLARVRLAL